MYFRNHFDFLVEIIEILKFLPMYFSNSRAFYMTINHGIIESI